MATNVQPQTGEIGEPPRPLDPTTAQWLVEEDLRIADAVTRPGDYTLMKNQKDLAKSKWAGSKDAAVRLRRAHGISTVVTSLKAWEAGDDWGYEAVVQATLPSGRSETAVGVCSYKELTARRKDVSRHVVAQQAVTRATKAATFNLVLSRHGETVDARTATRPPAVTRAQAPQPEPEPEPEPERATPKAPAAGQNGQHWLRDREECNRFWKTMRDLKVAPKRVMPLTGRELSTFPTADEAIAAVKVALAKAGQPA